MIKLINSIQEVAHKLYGADGNYVLDTDRLKVDIVEELGITDSNYTMTEAMIEKLFFQPITLREYAEINGVSYSLIQKSKKKYKSVRSDNIRGYFIDKYELVHTKRKGIVGKEFTTKLESNRDLCIKLTAEAKYRDVSVIDLIISLLEEGLNKSK